MDLQIIQKTSLNMRQRFSCKICVFKTTNENLLKEHMKNSHKNETEKQNKTISKEIKAIKSGRIYCEFCEKKFNKIETFNKHMKTYHKSNGETSSPLSQQIYGRSVMHNENTNIMKNKQESNEIGIEQEEMTALGSLYH